jgi:hypothetical protein
VDPASTVALERLNREMHGYWVTSRDLDTGWVKSLMPRGPTLAVLPPGRDPEATARAFLAKYGAILGIVDQAKELRLSDRRAPDSSIVPFSQIEGGLEVEDGGLSVWFAQDGRTKVMSHFVPHLSRFPTRPGLTPEAAVSKAVAYVTAKCPECGPTDGADSPATLVISPMYGAPKLVYRLYCAGAHFIVDASSGAVLSVDNGIRF